MLPKSGLSLYRALVEKKWARNVKYGELLLFTASMAIIMKSLRKDPHLLSPIVSRILNLFL